MGVRIINDNDQGYKVLYCSTTMVTFGDVFYEDEDVQSFLDWLPADARTYSEKRLSEKVYEWREYDKQIADIVKSLSQK